MVMKKGVNNWFDKQDRDVLGKFKAIGKKA